MHRRLLLLGLLRQHKMHGYQLNEFIERDLSFCAEVKRPTAYYLLEKLAEAGYITEEEGERRGGRPPRRIYRITPRGEAYFLELLRENLRTYRRVTFPGDMGIAFIDALPPHEARELLEERHAQMREMLERIQQISGHAGAPRLVIEHHITHLKAELNWLEEVLASLAQEEESAGEA